MNEKTIEQVLEETGTLCWKTKGNSMRPLLKEGRDAVVIQKRPAESLKKYDVILYIRNKNGDKPTYILHRILRINADGTYRTVGDNCIYGENVESRNILGVLTAIVRDKKTIHETDIGYKLYARVWTFCYPLRIAIFKFRRMLINIYKKLFR